jgi:dTDP-4-amino-4,6-dideoxygalactose transaminase
MIPFNRPYLTGRELYYIRQAHRRAQLAGDGYFTRKCQHWLEKKLGAKKAFLTHSCTSALEMAAILADIKPGDEVIMPSYTFVSTANAFVLRGGVPVFLDIRPDTLNIDEKLIEKAITRKTKAIVPVHYAGVGCEMDTILKIARKYRLLVIEDAAHAVKATYKGRELGTIGDLGTLSFHETKNIISGEGGALLVNNPKFIRRAEIVWQKGTDRSQFIRSEVDKYTWRDIGSSFLPGELVAAFLWAQLQKAGQITRRRRRIWSRYHKAFYDSEKKGWLRRPVISARCHHNAHMYYLLFNTKKTRDNLLEFMKNRGIKSVFHYIPLHRSKLGKKYLKTGNRCNISDTISERLIRLPMFTGLAEKQIKTIIDEIKNFLRARFAAAMRA